MSTVIEPNIDRPTAAGSDRNFGFVFAAASSIIACLPLLHGAAPRWWLLGSSVPCAAAALLKPRVLHPFNRAWTALGNLLHRMVSPVVMGAIFLLCITPIAWIMRRRGKDLLQLMRRADLDSYWAVRAGSPTVQSMRHQF